MEWNAKTPSEWDWENLAMYGGRTIEIPKRVQLSSNEAEGHDAVENVPGYSSSSGDFCGTNLGHGYSSKNMVSASESSSKERTMTLGVTDGFPKGSIEEEEFSGADKDRVYPNTGASVGSGEAMIGLKLGRRTYFEDMFHDLSEFDDRKRSCRRRLSDHNARRRRPPSEAMQFRSTRMSSSFCGDLSILKLLKLHSWNQRQGMDFLLNRVPIPLSNRTWERDCNFKVALAGDPIMNTAKGGATNRKSDCPSDSMSSAVSSPHSDTNRVYSSSATPPHVFNYGSDASAIANLDVAPEIRRALSLLSTNSWGFSEPEPTSLDQLVQGSLITVAQPVMQSHAQSWALASSVRVEQAPSHSQVQHSLDTQDTESTQFQEFHFGGGNGGSWIVVNGGRDVSEAISVAAAPVGFIGMFSISPVVLPEFRLNNFNSHNIL
ncbi:hypothetical protein RJ640_025536 [Escallonia rubra]|uniref:SBP-type domain-containing protein n=1 Tax=Escallonia rubra TaxID=112253 RepID=A0AA88RA98_9ASTE|nr:hypothetical protein RJ640_025536 [Escallonia rubra]